MTAPQGASLLFAVTIFVRRHELSKNHFVEIIERRLGN